MANRYWVGNGGNWNDTAHWSTTSGGASGASVPANDTDVFFDANSFTTAGQVVILNVNASCVSIDWLSVTNNPIFNLNNRGLIIYGASIVRFVSAMTITTTTGYIEFYTSPYALPAITLFDSGGHTLPYIYCYGDITLLTISLQNDLICGAAYIYDTNFQTNNFNITTTNANDGFYIDSTGVVDFGTSTITSASDIDIDYSGDNGDVAAENATFVMNGTPSPYFYASDNEVIGSLTMSNGGYVYLQTLGQGLTFTSLELGSGATYLFDANKTFNVTNFTAVGHVGSYITIRSDSSGTPFSISKITGTVDADYLVLKDSTAIGGATWNAGRNSINLSNNTGWVFDNNHRLWTNAANATGSTWLNQSDTLIYDDATTTYDDTTISYDEANNSAWSNIT